MHYGGSTYTNLGTVTAPRGQWGLIQGTFTVPAAQSVTTARIFVETPWTATPSIGPGHAPHGLQGRRRDAPEEFVRVDHDRGARQEPRRGQPAHLAQVRRGRQRLRPRRPGVHLHDQRHAGVQPRRRTGSPRTNTYGGINTITVISSDDLVNWVDHGEIPVAGPNGIAKYASQSWAPAIESKVVDGKEKFFLYFANNGGATGVIVGDSPLGPWRDERGSLLITGATPGASNGATGSSTRASSSTTTVRAYLYFGGGGDDGSRSYENTNRPKSTRVIKLGDDMISTSARRRPSTRRSCSRRVTSSSATASTTTRTRRTSASAASMDPAGSPHRSDRLSHRRQPDGPLDRRTSTPA